MSKYDLGLVLDRPIAFHRVFVSLTGSLSAAVMLSQALYWHTRSNGEWWKTQEEWFEECGLSRSELETARKKLVALGVLSHERKGLPARSFYRVNIDRIAELLPDCRNPANKDEPGNQVSGNPASQIAGILQTGPQESCNHLKNTEITSEITSERKDIPRKRGPAKTLLSDDFAITPSMLAWAQAKGLRVDIEREHERFINHHIAKANKYADWERAWKNWMSGAFVSKKPGAPAPRHRGLVL